MFSFLASTAVINFLQRDGSLNVAVSNGLVARSDVATYGQFPLQHTARMCGHRIFLDT
jgi:hypothetical protein